MNAVWRQLVWKEWREQFWKMIALTAIVISVEGYLFFSDERAGLAQLGLGLLCGVPGAFFIALGVAAGERTAGSLDFLRSFPLARWKWAVVRLAIGAVAAIVPVVAAAAVTVVLASAMRSARDAPRFVLEGGLSALACLIIYAWTVAAGVRRSSELRAGLAAICLFVAWFVLFALTTMMPSHRLVGLVLMLSPAGLTMLPNPDSPTPVDSYTALQVLCAQAAGLIVTTWWFLRCYARLTEADNRSPAASEITVPAALRPPRTSRLAAMIWKEYREALPMCLAGLAILAAMLLPFAMEIVQTGSASLLATMTNFIVFLGTLLASVVGVGGHAADLDAGVWQFWRSRPIRTAGWFWIKYFTGAAVLLVTVDGALAVVDLMAGGPALLVRDGQFWIGPLLHLFAYSTSVWLVCQLRQPIYAGILGLGVVMAILVLGEFPVGRPLLPWLSLSKMRDLHPQASLSDVLDWLATSYASLAAFMLALSAAGALLGWLAVAQKAPWSRIAAATRHRSELGPSTS